MSNLSMLGLYDNPDSAADALDALHEAGFDSNKVLVVPNGVDCNIFKNIEEDRKNEIKQKLGINSQDFIISNSTFAWWGAWLGDGIGKRVLIPTPWYGPGLSHINTDDLYPDEWEKIEWK